MLQTAASQHLLTGGTGWSWTYRYAKTEKLRRFKEKQDLCFGDGDTGRVCYWIRNSWDTNLWCSAWLFKKKISWKLCIFIISGSHLACVVFTSALGPIVRLKNYEWFLSLTWFKKRMPSLKNVNFSYHVSCAINACDKSVGVSLSKWLWKFARPCQQQFPSAAESLGCVNAGVWDRDWGEQHARRTLFSPIELQSLSSPFSGEILAECPPFICSPRQSSSPNDPHFSIFYTPEMGTAPIPLFLFIFHSFLSVRLCVFTFLHSNAKCMLSCWLPQIFRGLPTFYNPPVTGRSTR